MCAVIHILFFNSVKQALLRCERRKLFFLITSWCTQPLGVGILHNVNMFLLQHIRLKYFVIERSLQNMLTRIAGKFALFVRWAETPNIYMTTARRTSRQSENLCFHPHPPSNNLVRNIGLVTKTLETAFSGIGAGTKMGIFIIGKKS